MGLFKKYFGENCWVWELQEEMDIASREEFGIAIARHGLINLCMDRVGLHGLLYDDKKYELDIVDAYGNVKWKINRTVREVMMGSKVGGVRLWQVIMRAEKGGWEGYYPNGTDCTENKTLAQGWGGNLSGHLRFFLLKQRVSEESVREIITGCFSSDAVLMAEESKEDKYGRIINRNVQDLRHEVERIEKCSWVDTSKGLLEAEMKMAAARNAEPVIDPSSMASFNFSAHAKE